MTKAGADISKRGFGADRAQVNKQFESEDFSAYRAGLKLDRQKVNCSGLSTQVLRRCAGVEAKHCARTKKQETSRHAMQYNARKSIYELFESEQEEQKAI